MARVLKIDSLGMFEGNPEFKILTAPDYWLFRLVINFNQQPMDNIQFRQALAHAINRPEMVERVAHGGGEGRRELFVEQKLFLVQPTTMGDVGLNERLGPGIEDASR